MPERRVIPMNSTFQTGETFWAVTQGAGTVVQLRRQRIEFGEGKEMQFSGQSMAQKKVMQRKSSRKLPRVILNLPEYQADMGSV